MAENADWMFSYRILITEYSTIVSTIHSYTVLQYVSVTCCAGVCFNREFLILQHTKEILCCYMKGCCCGNCRSNDQLVMVSMTTK